MTYAQALFDTAYGRLDAAGVLAGYSTLLDVQAVNGSVTGNKGGATILFFFNTLDADVILSLDNGTTDAVYLHAGKSWTMDLSAGEMRYVGTIRVKRASGAAATGSIACTAVRTKV